MSPVSLKRTGTETVEFEPFAGIGKSGEPAYNAKRLVENVRAVEEIEVLYNTDGTNEQTTLQMWLPADADYEPTRDDRATYGDDFTLYVVRRVDKPKRLNGTVTHIRLWLREA